MLSSPKSQPDFIIAGAMKAATSAIYEYLMQHPGTIYRLPKELHFFTLNYSKGFDWYLSQFDVPHKNNNPSLLIGEASPSYLTSKKVPASIYNLFPDIKIIISLRNPTERAVSHYYHQVNRVKDEIRPIEIAFSQAEIENKTQPSPTKSYLALGKYSRQVRHWLDVFPSKQILFLNYHELNSDPLLFISKIFNFLNLENYQLDNPQKIYANKYPAIPIDIKLRLDCYFEPYNRELEKLIGMKL